MKKAMILGAIFAVVGAGIMLYAILFLGDRTPSETEAPGGSSANEIAIKELQIRKTTNSCWIAFSGRVFDITPYLNARPEVAKTFTTCGQSTNDLPPQFKKVSDLSTYQIGILTP